LILGTGIAGAIKQKGGERIQEDCDKYIRKNGEVKPGEVAVTGKGEMENPKLKYIYHAVGPKWMGGNEKEDLILKTCFDNIFHKANKSKINSIAIPLISSGVFGYPKDQASLIFLTSLDNFAKHGYSYPKEIYMSIFDTETFDIFNSVMKEFVVNKEINFSENKLNFKL
jgi:O-acetyl-ADP-ribose deacetylase (regulator of RNase III)